MLRAKRSRVSRANERAQAQSTQTFARRRFQTAVLDARPCILLLPPHHPPDRLKNHKNAGPSENYGGKDHLGTGEHKHYAGNECNQPRHEHNAPTKRPNVETGFFILPPLVNIML